MRAGTFFLSATLVVSSLEAANQNLNSPHEMNATNRLSATARVTVQHSEAKAYDEKTTPALKELTLQETFSGDMSGESLVRALQIFHGKESSTMISLQRFEGSLGRRKGTFILQGSEAIKEGRIHATWFVVPGTGTGELAGLRGEGGFEGDFGKGSEAKLEYWFEAVGS